MKVGIIGVGVVGGTLKRWFQEHTTHDVRCWDPHKNMNDSLEECSAIFISVPVPPSGSGQDTKTLEEVVAYAKQFTQYVFIRSTVLPGTNDKLGTISMPEYLTERRAYEDICKLPVLVGHTDEKLMSYLFPYKAIVMVSNIEAELAKFAHNCFGAMKVTYFNIIYQLAQSMGAEYENVLLAANLTGFLGEQHLQVPGPDGRFGFGGKCFPENIEAMWRFLRFQNPHLPIEKDFFGKIIQLNNMYRDYREASDDMPVELSL